MNPQRRRSIEAQAEQLLRDSSAYRVPVPIDSVIGHLNLKTTSTGLTADVSGILVVEKGHGVIGFNAGHPPVRKRFTIAHEIGHYVLHVKQAQSRLFVDRHVYRRDDESATGSDQEEVEANAFAAAFLMPKELVRDALKKQGLNLDDEEDLEVLARLFGVSTSAMSYRLANLGLVR
jgi:Zn-dependent peptidase ImmA (M78 family)